MNLEILQTKQSFFNKINKILKSKAKVHIATYNVWTGVLEDGRYTNDWGGRYINEVGALFDEMMLNKCDVQVKIGVPRSGKCELFDMIHLSSQEDGELPFNAELCSISQKDKKWDKRFEHMQNRWHKFKFHQLDNNHTKLVLISPNHYIIGGRNLSNSEDKDLSFYGNDQEMYNKLLIIFNELE